MKYGVLAAVALAMTGCGGGPGKAQTTSAPPADAPPAKASLPAPTSNEQCDAHTLAYLIGRPRTEIPAPVDPSRRRVSCTECVRADDYRPDRTDIEFDPRTGLVVSVKCG